VACVDNNGSVSTTRFSRKPRQSASVRSVRKSTSMSCRMTSGSGIVPLQQPELASLVACSSPVGNQQHLVKDSVNLSRKKMPDGLELLVTW